jgi:hypothetical protein
MTLWAADHPRPAVLSPCGAPQALTGVMIPEPATRYESVEFGRVRSGGLDLRVEQHVLATFSAIQMNAQVKGASKRAALGPYPWRPPE